MKPLKIIIAHIIIALVALSCSSNDSAPYEAKENRLLKEITEKTTRTFIYNAGNQLTKITELGDLGFGTTQSVENYTYGTDGKVTEIKEDFTGSSSFGFKYLYSYDANGRITVIAVKRYTGGSDYNSFSTIYYTYPNPNVIERYETRVGESASTKTVYDMQNGNTTGYSVYTGITSNTPNGTLNNTNVYSNYDNKKTPYAALQTLYQEPILYVNNLGQSQSSGSTVTYTYEYNDDGYPTKKTTAFNTTTSITTYVYERI